MRCNGGDNTKKLCDFNSIVITQKKMFFFLEGGGVKVVRTDANRQNQTKT